jgi:hypothetical protein
MDKVPRTSSVNPEVFNGKPLRLLDADDPRFLSAFQGVGLSLFGDNGCFQADLGGIKDWDVVEATEDIKLYEQRGKGNPIKVAGIELELTGGTEQWFADGSSLSMNELQYSNHGAAICWNLPSWQTCTVKKGAVMIVGIGGNRNTCLTGTCSFPGCTWPSTNCQETYNSSECGIDLEQVPYPNVLQYILNEDLANFLICTQCSLNATRLGDSTENCSLGLAIPPAS